MPRSWDVFCKVIDNYGDAAVCWRLAQQLAGEHGGQVRLWVDALAPLHALCPDVSADCTQQRVAGVEICRWDASADSSAPADIVIDAFGAGLPEAYIESMAKRTPRSFWIILEYLSAEPWVRDHHKLPSPHPRLPLERHFFFPGFVPGTGGVLREADHARRRAAFEADAAAPARFWKELGFEVPAPTATVVSLFGYENPAAAELLRAWADGERPIVVAVTQSRLRPALSAFFGAETSNGASRRRGSLEARFLPFLSHPRYDELLWASDWNFVRGEDSLVRALWAAKPLVWQIYPQQEQAHTAKLEAFLALYCAGLDAPTSAALRALWHAWNDPGWSHAPLGVSWEVLRQDPGRLRLHARDWTDRQAEAGELAGNLAQYCMERLK